jgi:hypothetical protein
VLWLREIIVAIARAILLQRQPLWSADAPSSERARAVLRDPDKEADRAPFTSK